MNLRMKTDNRIATKITEMTKSLGSIGAGKRSRTPDLRITKAAHYSPSLIIGSRLFCKWLIHGRLWGVCCDAGTKKGHSFRGRYE